MDFQGSSRTPAPFSASPAASYAGLGLGSIGARVRLGRVAGYYFSLEGSLRAASHTAETYLDMRDFLQVDARVQMFHSLETWGFPAFLDVQLGYRSRGQNGDEIRRAADGAKFHRHRAVAEHGEQFRGAKVRGQRRI